MLLDPLPMVAVEYQELAFVKKRRQRVIPTMANLWFRREELAAANRSAKRAHNDSHRHKHVHDWMEETIDLQEQAEHAVVGGESRCKRWYTLHRIFDADMPISKNAATLTESGTIFDESRSHASNRR